MEPLENLFEAAALPESRLTRGLEEMYGGPLGFDDPRVYANFVSTVDGVVAITALRQSNKLIRARGEGDRFVVGLLRAFADVVLTGARTFAAFPRGSWMPDRAYPPAAAQYAELRRKLGKNAEPEVAVLTGSGAIDPAHPALESGAVVVTSDQGAARLDRRLPAASTVISVGPEPQLDPRAVIGVLHELGHRLILCETGPRTFGSLVRAGLVDELFLTVSPLVAGGSAGGDRLGVVAGVEFLPRQLVRTRLLSLRRQGDHLYCRYALAPPEPA